jgi:hypothetical protein
LGEVLTTPHRKKLPSYDSFNKRRMRWAGHVARMSEGKGAYRILVGRPEGKNHMEDPGVDGTIILKSIFMKWDGGTWTGLIWLRIGTGGGLL